MTSLMIVQSYIPEYRAPFFLSLRESLSTVGVNLTIAAVGVGPKMSLRRDDVTSQIADMRLKERSMHLGGTQLAFRNVGQALAEVRPDMLILEQAVKNTEVIGLLGKPHFLRRQSIGLWGHGRTFSQSQGRGVSNFKTWLTNRADWFFSYTTEGATYIIEQGFPPNRVSAVQNTIDVSRLQQDMDRVGSVDLSHFQGRYGLTPGQTGLFLGGVDEAKGMDFLISAAYAIAALKPDFRLLIGGSGSMDARVQDMESDGAPIRYLGRVTGHHKALALRAADVLLIPEWVGLVAVDSLASARPVITTNHPSHSPEFAYLTSGKTTLITSHDISAYAKAVVELLEDSDRLRNMKKEAGQSAAELRMDEMVSRFVRGVRSWASSGRR